MQYLSDENETCTISLFGIPMCIETRISACGVFSLAFAMLSILKSWTFVRQSGNYYEHLIADILIAVFSLISFLIYIIAKAWSIENISFCIFPAFYVLIKAYYRSDGNVNWENAGVTVVFIACVYLVLNDEYKTCVYNILRTLFVVMAVISIVCFISYVLNAFLPYEYVQFYAKESQPNARYINFNGFVLFRGPNGMLRICGVFNEPGLFGTFLGLLLISDNINLCRISNWVLILAGVLTFSMAFFILILGWCIVKYRSNWKISVVFLISLLGIMLLPRLKFSNLGLSTLINRFLNMENNRESQAFLDDFKNIIKTEKRWFGVGANFSSYSTSSLKMYVIKYGILGTFCYVLYVIRLGWNYSERSIVNLAFITCFVLSMYQRPDVIAPVYFIILIGGIKNINERYQRKEN